VITTGPLQFPGGRGQLTLRCRWLLPVTAPALENAWLRIDRGRVRAVGNGAMSPQPGGSCFDLGDAIVVPGLINAHTHLEFSACEQPFATAGGLPGWIGRVVAWRRQRSESAGFDQQAAVHRGLEELAADGIVAVGEIASTTPQPAVGFRGPRLRIFRELLGLAPLRADRPAAVAEAIRDTERLARAGVAMGLSPHAPYSTQWPLGRVALRAAGRLKRQHRQPAAGLPPVVPLAMHLAESAAEAEFLCRQTGPFRDLFEQLGVWPARPPTLATTADWISLLARSDRGLVVHGTHLPADPLAFARLARHRDRLAVVVCPRTTLAIAGRLPPVAAFRRAGLRVCLGTDGRGSNPDLSIRKEARCLIDAGIVSPVEALRMVTADAAWPLGFEDRTGCIAVGRPADLAILRPAAAAVHAADAAAAVFAADTEVVATLRGGRCISGKLPSG